MIVPADTQNIEAAAHALLEGKLVAFPTETVYGLGANATNGLAVVRVFEAKGRPRFNPLIVHVPDAAAASELADMTPLAVLLAERFWPGPLTMVLPRRTGSLTVSELVMAGLDTIAIRVPSHEIAQSFLRAAAVPVAAPSANVSGHVSATHASHVFEDLGASVDRIIDGGAARIGLESTIVSLADVPTLLRAGAIPREDIEAALGQRLAVHASGAITAPGQLASHYAPRSPLRLNATHAHAGELFLGFGSIGNGAALNLSEGADLREAAANLFAHLRRLDARRPNGIAVAPIPANGLGEAINDRLRRAAAPR